MTSGFTGWCSLSGQWLFSDSPAQQSTQSKGPQDQFTYTTGYEAKGADIFSDCFIGSLYRRGKSGTRNINQEHGKQAYGKLQDITENTGERRAAWLWSLIPARGKRQNCCGSRPSWLWCETLALTHKLPSMAMGIFIEIERPDVTQFQHERKTCAHRRDSSLPPLTTTHTQK